MSKTIVFPEGMELKEIDDTSVIMVQAGAVDDEPGCSTIGQVRQLFDGIVEEGNTGFISGATMYEILDTMVITPEPSLYQQLLTFGENGKLAAAGSYNDFLASFTNNLPEELK